MAIKQIKIRGGTAAQWLLANTVLAARELAIETDTHKFKIGDGATPWISLPYSSGSQGPQGIPGASGLQTPVYATGTADAILADYTPDVSLADKTVCLFFALYANATATPTFSPDGLTAHVITKKGGSPLVPGDIPGPNALCLVSYNLANTRWELLNPAVSSGGGISVATTVGGTADAVTATYTPTITALTDKQMLAFIATGANTSTTPTFAPDGLTARTIKTRGSQALVAGDIFGAGMLCILCYIISDTHYELVNPAAALYG